MKHSARIAALSVLFALVCAPYSEAARGIRTDNDSNNGPTNGWASCDVYACDWSGIDGVLFNPIGLTPLEPSAYLASDWYLAGGNETNVNSGSGDYQASYSGTAPGLT